MLKSMASFTVGFTVGIYVAQNYPQNVPNINKTIEDLKKSIKDKKPPE